MSPCQGPAPCCGTHPSSASLPGELGRTLPSLPPAKGRAKRGTSYPTVCRVAGGHPALVQTWTAPMTLSCSHPTRLKRTCGRGCRRSECHHPGAVPGPHSHCHLVQGLLGPVSHPRSCTCALVKRGGRPGMGGRAGQTSWCNHGQLLAGTAPLFSPWPSPTFWGAFPSQLLASWPFLLASSHNPKMSPSVLHLWAGTPPSPGCAGVPARCLSGRLRLPWAPLRASVPLWVWSSPDLPTSGKFPWGQLWGPGGQDQSQRCRLVNSHLLLCLPITVSLWVPKVWDSLL